MTEWTAASGARNVSRKNNWWVSDGNGRAAETSNGRLRTFKTIESARKAAVALNLAEQRRVTEEWNARLLAEDNTQGIYNWTPDEKKQIESYAKLLEKNEIVRTLSGPQPLAQKWAEKITALTQGLFPTGKVPCLVTASTENLSVPS